MVKKGKKLDENTRHVKKKGQKIKSKRSEIASTSKRARVVDSDNEFEDLPPQFQKKV